MLSLALGAEVGAAAGEFDFFDWRATGVARPAAPAVNLEILKHPALATIGPAIIARGGAFFLNRQF